MARLSCALLLSWVVANSASPIIDINLDAVPEARWGNVSKHYTKEIRPMMDQWEHVLNKTYTPAERDDWINTLKLTSEEFEEYYRELVGVVGWFMKPEDTNPQLLLDNLLLFNAIYELGSPLSCSGLLMADPKGRVFHGRNMDYGFPFMMPDGRLLDLPDVTYTARYWKDGKLLITAPQFLLFTGIHTGMREGSTRWTVEQNTRHTNEVHANLAALKDGKGDIFGWRMRKIMEHTPSFQGAVTTLLNTEFIAPQYFILSGSGPYEGAVITVDRGAEHLQDTPTLRVLSEENGTWHLLQTNDDANKQAEDPRRPSTNLLLSTENQTQVNTSFMWKNIRSPTLVSFITVFTWVADPSTGYSKLITRNEAVAAPALALPAQLQVAAGPPVAAQVAPRGRVGHTKWARQALLAHESG